MDAARPSPKRSEPSAGGEIFRILHRIDQEPTGLAAGAVVLVLCIFISWIGWTPLSWLPRLMGTFVPEGNCIGKTPGSLAMYLCSAKVGMLTLMGSIAFLVLIILLRMPLKRKVKQYKKKIQGEVRFLIAPLFATLVFVAAWAGVHYSLSGQTGIVSQRTFPALIGLFTFVVERYGNKIQRTFRPLFQFRDKFPKWIRYMMAFLIPVVFSLIVTFEDRVTQEALKEQLTVVVALVTGFLALTSQKGDARRGV